MKYIKLPNLIIACLILGALYINSASWFRLKLADYYKDNKEFVKAIETYNKILRKCRVKDNISGNVLAKINFDIGHLYGSLNFINSAIEYYARSFAKAPVFEIDSRGLEKNKLLAIGLLEGGRLDKALKAFQKLKRSYSQFQEAEKYINASVSLINQSAIRDDKKFFFLLGDAYVQNQLFDEAKAFFTKRILDYGIHPLEVLNYLQKTYSEENKIIQRVWGDNIYITLEDFESINSRLNKWESEARAKINNHYISTTGAHKGSRSEFMDITFAKEGYDYWVKPVNIPLTNPDLVLGVRAFIKSEGLFKGSLEMNILYPKQGTTGMWQADVREDIGGEWEKRKIGNLSEKAKTIASRFNWNMSGMKLDRVVINTAGVSGRFYIDDIELYLID